MNLTRAAGAALLVAVAATACSSGTPAPRATVTKTVYPTPEATPSQEPDDALKMGTVAPVQDEQGVHLTIQAVDYQQPYKGPRPQKPDSSLGGDTWATARIKVCDVSGGILTVDQAAWSLSYPDGTSIDVTGLTGGDMPKPEFPAQKTITVGQCAAGLVSFAVPGKKRPARLTYQPTDTTTVEWAITQ
ncbi:DUF4352 domain-containing protein (plasmid) [Streptomyces sp. NEAU-sy36]|uniref:DUF4352 domain-containing protein n=1 Tax=unclassified Streptomyces TaxID=2593676 RepID=UPI0015D5C26F|nr:MULTISPECIES: DUF4352 domain-containing protein [unclassified Streptomyces]QLJ06700.1 DUF4352 domain-containing protein [Streptomyces sp. NEAU-sy36]